MVIIRRRILSRHVHTSISSICLWPQRHRNTFKVLGNCYHWQSPSQYRFLPKTYMRNRCGQHCQSRPGDYANFKNNRSAFHFQRPNIFRTFNPFDLLLFFSRIFDNTSTFYYFGTEEKTSCPRLVYALVFIIHRHFLWGKYRSVHPCPHYSDKSFPQLQRC